MGLVTFHLPAGEEKAPRKWSILAWIFDLVEALLNLFVPKKGNAFLEKGYAPVPEGPLQRSLPVRGTLPDCLNGEFVRNGPNPKHPPTGGYHLFDGDGMLHGVRIKDGKASYVNRYVQTSRLQQETAYGAPKFIKLGDMRGYVGLAKTLLDHLRKVSGVTDDSHGRGTGNTALVFHGNALLALHEGDAPYVIRVLADGELETAGRLTYDGRLGHSFTAHPKVDPVTGEMFTFGYDVQGSKVEYRVVSSDGVMSPDVVTIRLPRPIMMHDFAITEHYAVFMDLPLVFEPKAIVSKGFPFVFDTTASARFGLLPRYAKSEAAMQWFTLPSQFIFHNANAWEEGDEVVLVACRYPEIDLTGVHDHSQTLFEYRFNTKTGEAVVRELANIRSEFPRINDAYTGRKQRFVYCAVTEGDHIIGVAKYDLTAEPELGEEKHPRAGGTCAAYFSHGPARSGSEAVFVPKNGDGSSGPEDDGYLLTFVFDESTGLSEMVVIDAKTMAPEPTAVVALPRRVPNGFHGIFVSEEQIRSQNEAKWANGIQ